MEFNGFGERWQVSEEGKGEKEDSTHEMVLMIGVITASRNKKS